MDKNDPDSEALQNNTDYLNLINKLDNANKHSIINMDNPRFGTEEPCIYVNYAKYNDYNKSSEEIIVSVGEIVDGFNLLYGDMLYEISGKW